MAKVVINKEKCKGCLLCVSFCPKALFIVEEKLNSKGVKPVKLKEVNDCVGCGQCAVICPECCIEIYE